ncbi:hypothetical protein HPY31_01405 [Brevibacillus sp. HB1.3]|uniref:hypothetical protein n=1 Tax=Brevibacillus sp. HB1.3 TaxID=2738842 RepID=UPI0015535640|nr:hypothetical protein [Brevibacillus sp. HB1.3]NQF12574.1 hypothetical protein [Brevibacillus sp. HB1.3]
MKKKDRLNLLKEVYTTQLVEGKFTFEKLVCGDKDSFLRYTMYLYLEDHGWVTINQLDQNEYVVRITGAGIDLVEKISNKVKRGIGNIMMVLALLYSIAACIPLYGVLKNGEELSALNAGFFTLTGFIFTVLGTAVTLKARSEE